MGVTGTGKSKPATFRSNAMSFTEPQDANEPESEPKSQDHGPVPFPGQGDDFGLTPKPREPKVKTQRVDPLLGVDLGGVKIVRLEPATREDVHAGSERHRENPMHHEGLELTFLIAKEHDR